MKRELPDLPMVGYDAVPTILVWSNRSDESRSAMTHQRGVPSYAFNVVIPAGVASVSLRSRASAARAVLPSRTELEVG